MLFISLCAVTALHQCHAKSSFCYLCSVQHIASKGCCSDCKLLSCWPVQLSDVTLSWSNTGTAACIALQARGLLCWQGWLVSSGWSWQSATEQQVVCWLLFCSKQTKKLGCLLYRRIEDVRFFDLMTPVCMWPCIAESSWHQTFTSLLRNVADCLYGPQDQWCNADGTGCDRS